jgi:hypothetical protein
MPRRLLRQPTAATFRAAQTTKPTAGDVHDDHPAGQGGEHIHAEAVLNAFWKARVLPEPSTTGAHAQEARGTNLMSNAPTASADRFTAVSSRAGIRRAASQPSFGNRRFRAVSDRV